MNLKFERNGCVTPLSPFMLNSPCLTVKILVCFIYLTEKLTIKKYLKVGESFGVELSQYQWDYLVKNYPLFLIHTVL